MYKSIDNQTYLIDVELGQKNFAACYLVQDADELALIDCGTARSVPKVLHAIDAIGCSPMQVRWIIPTHIHLDHAGGAGQLMQACPNARLVVHPKGLLHMVDPVKLQAGSTAVYGEEAFERDYDVLLPIPEERCIAAEDGQVFHLGERTLTFIHTPGHANHHGCIYDDTSRYLFAGDTFGIGYQELAQASPYLLATTSPVAFDPDAWYDSLDRMETLNPCAVCLTHFGKYTYSADLQSQLIDSIEAHKQIALHEESNSKEGRYERLYAMVEKYLMHDACNQTNMPVDQLRKQLSIDITLNAQGLEVWLSRRAARR